MNRELQERFENHAPIMIYPFGVGNPTGPRVIAEGFVYSEGVFFFDVGWNAPMGGTGSDHFVEGRIEGPFPDFEETLYWKVGELATIHEIPEDCPRPSFREEFVVAENNLRLAKEYEGDKYKSRDRAQELANQFINDLRER